MTGTHLENLSPNSEPFASEAEMHVVGTSKANPAFPRNSNINSLPIELLTMIITMLRGNIFGRFDATVRSVCRLWLHVVDSTPALWTHLVLEHPVVDFDRFCVILQLSRGAALDLSIKLTSMSKQLLSALLPVMSRVRSLQLDCVPYVISKPAGVTDAVWSTHLHILSNLAQQLIRVPAPSLEVLEIGGLDLPPDIFSNVVPIRLQDLCLVDCYLESSASRIFRSTELTRITMVDGLVWDSLDEVLTLLSALPKLQHFTWNSEPNEGPPSFYRPHNFGRKSVHLPDLKNMNFCLPIHTFTLLIPIIDFPQKTHLTIEGWLPEDPQLDASAFMPLMDTLQSVFEPRFKSLFPGESEGYTDMHFSRYIRHIPDEGFRVKMFHAESSLTRIIPTFTLGVSWNHERDENYIEIMTHLLNWHGMAANIRSVSATRLKSGFLKGVQQWEHLLSPLPRVSALTIVGVHASPLFDLLSTHAVQLSQFIPALEKVSLQDAKADVVALIFNMLDRRVEAGLPKLEFSFLNCEIEAAALRRLEQHQGVKQAHSDQSHLASV